jgi:hypothetical protein
LVGHVGDVDLHVVVLSSDHVQFTGLVGYHTVQSGVLTRDNIDLVRQVFVVNDEAVDFSVQNSIVVLKLVVLSDHLAIVQVDSLVDHNSWSLDDNIWYGSGVLWNHSGWDNIPHNGSLKIHRGVCWYVTSVKGNIGNSLW